MKRRFLSILAVLALCLTMLPMAAFAAPISWPAEGEAVTLDGKEYTYLGDVTETGLAVGEWEVDLYGPAGIAKAGDGYVSYYVEEGIAYITANNATISAMSGEDLEGYGILVVDYDAHINGIGTNIIQAGNTAIDATGCLTITGEFQRIAGMYNGIACYQSWGFGEEEVTTEGGDLMINANIGEVVGTDGMAIQSDCSLIINGDLGDVSGGSGIYSGDGLTQDNLKEGYLTINGTIGSVMGYVNAGIHGRGDVTIGQDAVIGEIVADTVGISADCITDEDWAPLADASLTIQGQVGPISASMIQEDTEDWIRFGIYVAGGDVVIAEGASVASVYGDTYGAWVEGGEVIVKGSVPGGITGGEQDIYTEEWPSFWAHAEVMDAILWGLVPEDLQGKYTQATTRAEYCALATCLYEAVTGESIELTEEDVLPFTDVEDDVNIAKMYKIGVVNGVGDNRFAPNNILTREQAATMLSRLAYAVGEPLEASAPDFADNDKIFDYAYEAVGQVQAAGIMQGKENKLFDPKGSYTREQSILTMDRLFDLVFWDNDDE
ncbi:MAG: S-layer homology domain-containing protein [Ruminiclostridium sp.]|nr:S-layer homology domain-containing protein [Ruminiclostridium sp.]